jgi:hypothetical protein
MSSLKRITLIVITLVLAACSRAGGPVTLPVGVPETPTLTESMPAPSDESGTLSPSKSEQTLNYPDAVLAALADLALRLEIAVDQIRVLEVESMSWPDSCLGVTSPDEMCLQVITPGHRIVLEANGQSYEYHTDATGTNLRIAPGQGAFPGSAKPGLDLNKPVAVLAAMRLLSQLEGIELAEISIVSIEPVEWPDSCLGLPEPGDVCAGSIVPGWLIFLKAENEQFELHSDINGVNIRQK